LDHICVLDGQASDYFSIANYMNCLPRQVCKRLFSISVQVMMLQNCSTLISNHKQYLVENQNQQQTKQEELRSHTGLTPPHFCVWSKPGPRFPMSFVCQEVLFYRPLLKVCDNLLVMGRLNDDDLLKLLTLINPMAFDTSQEGSMLLSHD
jgi:hypothetical protein